MVDMTNNELLEGVIFAVFHKILSSVKTLSRMTVTIYSWKLKKAKYQNRIKFI